MVYYLKNFCENNKIIIIMVYYLKNFCEYNILYFLIIEINDS